MSHTPGPWESRCVGSGGAPDNPEDMYEVVTVAAGPRICEYVWEADARLIAAAPELLRACETFVEWLRREDAGFVKAGNDRSTPEGDAKWREWYNENLRICDEAQTKARAAIAKATGADK